MMKTIENLKFWFTPEGGDEYQKIVNNYFQNTFSNISKVELIKKTEFDILKLYDFPYEDMCTFITKELSSYILGDNITGYTRIELAITVDNKYCDYKFDIILNNLAQNQLENRVPFELNDVIKLSHNEKEIFPSKTNNLSNALIAGTVWLDCDSQGFIGDINTNIIEVVFISDTESEIVKSSLDSFKEKTQEGEIDILDLDR